MFLYILLAIIVGLILLKIYTIVSCGRYKITEDLSGKSIIITGANAGIGKAMTKELARAGATVHMACRNKDKAESAAQEIRTETGNNRVHVWILDTSSLSSVRKFASSFLQTSNPIHVLINNAGIGGSDKCVKTEDGLELIMATNHFGPFLLTNLLLERIKESAPSRIVNTSSSAQRFVSLPLDADKLNFANGYSDGGVCAYFRSKLADLLFTVQLSTLLEGSGVTANAYHPGSIHTAIFHDLFPFLPRPVKWLIFLFLKTVEEGAESGLYMAVGGKGVAGVSGKYYWDNDVSTMNRQAHSPTACKQIWDISAHLTGLEEGKQK